MLHCKGPLKGGCQCRFWNACFWGSVVLQLLRWMAVGNILFSTGTLPLKRTSAVRQILRLPRQHGLWRFTTVTTVTASMKNGTRGTRGSSSKWNRRMTTYCTCHEKALWRVDAEIYVHVGFPIWCFSKLGTQLIQPRTYHLVIWHCYWTWP